MSIFSWCEISTSDIFRDGNRWSASMKIHEQLDQLQCNRNKKRFIEIGLKSLVWLWVTFLLPTILTYTNNINKKKKSNHQSNIIFVITRSSPVKRTKNQVNRASRCLKNPTSFWPRIHRHSGPNSTGLPYKKPRKQCFLGVTTVRLILAIMAEPAKV
jgi:hypothetical protein